MMFLPDSDEDYDDFDYDDYFLNGEYYDDYDLSYSGDESVDDDEDSRMYSEGYYMKESNRGEHCMKIVDGLNADRHAKEMCDGLISVDGKDFPVHRVVLTVASPYFRAMFAGSFNESQQKCIEIKDIAKEPFEVVLNYIYGETGGISEENILEVYECADMLCVDSVLKECKDFLRYKCLQMQDKIAAYNLSKRMELKETTDCIVKHFHRNFTQLVKESYFLDMPYEVLQELIQKRLISSSMIDSTIQSIIPWVTHKPDERLVVTEKLLIEIHLDQVTNSTMQELTAALGSLEFADNETAKSRDALVQKIQSNSMLVRQKIGNFQLKLRCVRTIRQEVEVHEFHHAVWDWTKHTTSVGLNNEMTFALPDSFPFDKDEKRQPKPKFTMEEVQAVAALRDEVILFGNSTVLAFNITNGTTRPLPSLPHPRTHFSAVAHEDHSIMVVGGNAKEMLRYDARSNSWAVVSTWYRPRSNCGVIVHNNVLYMMGGYNNKETSTTNYVISYNFHCRRFVRLPKMIRRVHSPRVAVFKHMLFVFGQEVSQDFIAMLFKVRDVNLCQIYNISKGTWSDSEVTISSQESILAVKSVADGVLVILLRRDGESAKITLSLYKPEQDQLDYVGCLPIPKEQTLFNSKFFFADVF